MQSIQLNLFGQVKIGVLWHINEGNFIPGTKDIKALVEFPNYSHISQGARS